MDEAKLPDKENEGDFKSWALARADSATRKKQAAERKRESMMKAEVSQVYEEEHNNSGEINYEMIEYLQDMLNNKTAELEMTAEYGLNLTQANEQLTAANTQLEADVEQMRTLIHSLENEVTNLKVALASASMSPRRHSSAGLEDEEERTEAAELNAMQQQARAKKLEKELEETKEALRLAEEAVEDGKERDNWLNGQVERLKEKVSEMESDQMRWREEEEILREQLRQANESGGVTGTDDELQAQLAEAVGDRQRLKEKVSHLQDVIDKLRKDMDDLRDENNDHIARMDTFGSRRDSGNLADDLGDYDEMDQFNDIPADEPAETGGKSVKELEIDANLAAARELVDKSEVAAYAGFINHALAGDEELSSKLPIADDIAALHGVCRDGRVLCKLVNLAVPDTIDERVINAAGTDEEATENFRLCIDSCKSIGCQLPNGLQIDHILSGVSCDMLLNLIWAILKVKLSAPLSVSEQPLLKILALPEESIDELARLPTEQTIMRWINHHFKKAKLNIRIKNLDDDLSDCEGLSTVLSLLHQIPDEYVSQYDRRARVTGMLKALAEKFPDRYLFASPQSIMERQPRLMFAFLATLFTLEHGLHPEDGDRAKMNRMPTDPFQSRATTEDQREAEVFTLWINSLGIEPPVKDIFTDLRDGLVLLRVFDHLNPGAVDWKQVANKTPIPKFMRLQNTNYVVKLCKVMKFSLVGIAGDDLEDGSPKMTLALVWQMMRYHIQTVLQSLSGSNKPITDAELLAWANKQVEGSGGTKRIKNFKDENLQDGVFCLELIDSLKPGLVQKHLIQHGTSKEDYEKNAKYAISLARKIGASIFLCVNDILRVHSKMLFTFVAALMATTVETDDTKKKIRLATPISMLGVDKKHTAASVAALAKRASRMQMGGGATTPRQGPAAAVQRAKVLEAQVKQLQNENADLAKTNKQLCAEVGKLRAQVMGQFVFAAKQSKAQINTPKSSPNPNMSPSPNAAQRPVGGQKLAKSPPPGTVFFSQQANTTAEQRQRSQSNLQQQKAAAAAAAGNGTTPTPTPSSSSPKPTTTTTAAAASSRPTTTTTSSSSSAGSRPSAGGSANVSAARTGPAPTSQGSRRPTIEDSNNKQPAAAQRQGSDEAKKGRRSMKLFGKKS